MAIFRRAPLTGASNAGGIKSCDFRPISRFISMLTAFSTHICLKLLLLLLLLVVVVVVVVAVVVVVVVVVVV